MTDLTPDIAAVLAEWLPLAAEAGEAALKDEAPTGQTGAYREGIASELQEDAVDFTADDPLSTWITRGTAPHSIDPVNAKALHFEAGGGEVFARHVDHPGTQPNDFVAQAMDHSEIEALDDQLADIWLAQLGDVE